MAGLVLKQFIEKNWTPNGYSFDGFEPTPEV